MSGLFVQKHVEAVRAQGVDVRVIHALTWRDTLQQWRTLRREGWMPDLVQLNVIQKQGLLALWLKKRYNIPYVIIEHWSGYLPENATVKAHGLHLRFMQRVCSEAEVVMPVSLPLQQAMQALGFQAKRWQQIHNVVDDFFFENPKSEIINHKSEIINHKSENLLANNRLSKARKEIINHKSEIINHKSKTLLHVSCFDERAKNVKGLLQAAKMLSLKRQDWQLVLVGTGIDYADVRAYADALEFPEGMLVWTGELTPREVAAHMQEADALVLSSRYETYGIVLAEASAAGLPILSTPVGIAEEVADLIVPQEVAQHKPGRFADFIETILWNTKIKNHMTVSPSNGETLDGRGTNHQSPIINQYTADAVGRQLLSVYAGCLRHDI